MTATCPPCRFLWPAAILALLLTAGGCAPTGAPAASVTLDFAAPDSNAEYWEKLLDPFSWEDAMEDEALLSLDVFIEEDSSFDREDYPAGALALFERDGKQWCIPFEADAFVMYYNKDLFDRAGLPYPRPGWTWDDFSTAAQAIRDPDAGTYGYLSPHSDRQRIDALLFILTHGAAPFGTGGQDAEEETRLDDPSIVEAVTFWADLLFRLNVAPTQDQLSDELGGGLSGELAAKQEGKAGMWMDWYSARREVAGLLRDRGRWGMTTIPADRRAGTFAVGRGLCIAADAADPEAAWQLVAFLSRQPSESLFPVRRSVARSETYVRQAGEEAAQVAAASMEDAEMISPRMLRSARSFERLFYALSLIAGGRASVTEALRRVASGRDSHRVPRATAVIAGAHRWTQAKIKESRKEAGRRT